MPRHARRDAPGTLHHVMVRGMERTAIVWDGVDRADVIARLARVAATGALRGYAWARLPKHAHLVVRTGRRPLARARRSLLTGYAGAVNRRHQRVGHLFQNRDKSVVVEEEPYLLDLVRSRHLNPLRVGLVPDLRTLARDPWAGQSALLGTVARPWQATGGILGPFGRRRARPAYRAFVAGGIAAIGRQSLMVDEAHRPTCYKAQLARPRVKASSERSRGHAEINKGSLRGYNGVVWHPAIRARTNRGHSSQKGPAHDGQTEAHYRNRVGHRLTLVLHRQASPGIRTADVPGAQA